MKRTGAVLSPRSASMMKDFSVLLVKNMVLFTCPYREVQEEIAILRRRLWGFVVAPPSNYIDPSVTVANKTVFLTLKCIRRFQVVRSKFLKTQ